MNRIRDIKLKGGMLYLVLGTSLVMALVLSFIILLRYYHKLHAVDMDTTLRLERNMDSAIEWVKADPYQFVGYGGYTVADLFGEGQDSVIIHSDYWGLYQLLHVEAVKAGRKKSRSALLGLFPNHHQDKALLLGRSRSKLKVLGNTLIKGDVSVPSGNVSAGWFDGKGYKRKELVNGNITGSPLRFPTFNNTLIGRLVNVLKEKITDTPPAHAGLLETDTTRSYGKGVLYYTNREAFELKHRYSGRIMFHSSEAITVSPSSELDGVVLVAPAIRIEEGVRGSFQAFATEKIMVNDDVILSYPSCLGLLASSDTAKIEVGAARLEGAVVGLERTPDKQKNIRLILHEKAEVTGEVYVEEFFEHYGRVNGTITCGGFLFSKGGEIRDNALWNATIDRAALPENFAFTFLQEAQRGARVIKWLDNG